MLVPEIRSDAVPLHPEGARPAGRHLFPAFVRDPDLVARKGAAGAAGTHPALFPGNIEEIRRANSRFSQDHQNEADIYIPFRLYYCINHL